MSFYKTGVARGCGWQHLGAYVNLGSFYLIGIPTAVTLGFFLKMGGRGLWMGIVCGSISQTTLLILITSFTNWQEMVCSPLFFCLIYLDKLSMKILKQKLVLEFSQGYIVPRGKMSMLFRYQFNFFFYFFYS